MTQDRNRLPIYTLLTANAVSTIGNVLTMVAVPWFVLQTTGSAAKMGLTGFFTALPLIIAGIFGGAIVDRLGFKTTSIVSDLASAVTVACIPLLHLTVGIEFWQLLALVFLSALLDTPGVTARRSMLPDLATQAGMRFERSNAAQASIARFASLLGPPLAGLLIAAIGASNVLWVNAATFLVSASLIGVLIPGTLRRARDGGPASGYLRELQAGFRYVREDRLVLSLVLALVATNFLDAMGIIIWPILADQLFGSAIAFGLIVGIFGGGALVGAIIFGATGHRWPRRGTFLVSFIIVALPMGFIALFPPLPVVLALLFVRGLGAGPINPLLDTVFQERVPVEMRGRVFGLLTSIAWISMPVGSIVGGYMIEFVGLRLTIILVGVSYVVATLSMLRIPALREMNQVEQATVATRSVA